MVQNVKTLDFRIHPAHIGRDMMLKSVDSIRDMIQIRLSVNSPMDPLITLGWNLQQIKSYFVSRDEVFSCTKLTNILEICDD